LVKNLKSALARFDLNPNLTLEDLEQEAGALDSDGVLALEMEALSPMQLSLVAGSAPAPYKFAPLPVITKQSPAPHKTAGLSFLEAKKNKELAAKAGVR
jgi:hypothetical protein